MADSHIECSSAWLWITEKTDRNAQAMAYATTYMKQKYITKTSNYMPCSDERFNCIAEGKVLEKQQVLLLFLAERSSRVVNLFETISDTFKAPNMPLFTRAGMYTEHTLCVKVPEVRLKLYY